MKNNRRAMAVVMLTSLFWLSFLPFAWAADVLQYQDPVAAPPSMGGMLLRMVISLVIVIGLALVLVKLLQKNTVLAGSSSWAKVIDQCMLSQNQRLVLVEMFGKVYVLGVTEHNITAILAEGDIDASQIEELKVTESKRAQRTDIASLFRGNFQKILDDKIGALKKYYSNSGRDE